MTTAKICDHFAEKCHNMKKSLRNDSDGHSPTGKLTTKK